MLGQRKKIAFEIVKASGNFIKKNFGKRFESKEKSSNDYVTDADMELEKRIIDKINEKFPNDNIISEERGSVPGSSDFTWMIDPLDGTNNYRRQIPLAGMQMAILEKGKPIFGIVNDVFSGRIYYAEKGRGAFVSDENLLKIKKIRVSDRCMEKSLVIVSNSITNDPDGSQKKILNKLLPNMGTIRIYGVAVLDLPFVAAGNAEALISFAPKSYDITPGSIVIEEAGGKVTTFEGEAWFPEMKTFVASNGIVHDKILQIICHP